MMKRRQALQAAATAASVLTFPTLLLKNAEASDADDYQRVWDADQSHRGVPAIGPRERGDTANGFVRVDENGGDNPNHRVIAEVSIPERKRLTYDLTKPLFDNYRLDQTKREDTTQAEAQEMLALLDAVTDSAPMEAAKDLIGQRQGTAYSRDEFQNLLFDIWFRQYDMGRNVDLSGFEHVVVGEQKAGTAGGHHFWYRYYLDDFGLLGTGDNIDFQGTRYPKPLIKEGRATPEVVTLSYRWRAEDHDWGEERPLFKPTGGFWVGCSVEGLMALGVVRFFERGRVQTVINGIRYEIDLYRSPDGQSIRSYFPIFKGFG